MRYYIIGADGNVHGEAETIQECESILSDVEYTLRKKYSDEYVDDLELEIIEGI